jgi:hypothetical protein
MFMEASAEIGRRLSVARAPGDRGVPGFVRIASDLVDQPQNGDRREKSAGNNVHFSVPKIVIHQRLYSEQFATLLAENNSSSFPKATKLRSFTVRSSGGLSGDDSRHFSTLIGAALGLVLMVSTGTSLWYATLGVMPKESPSNGSMAVAGHEVAPTISLAQSRRPTADEIEENAQAAIQLAPITTSVLSSIEAPVQQVLQSLGRLQAAIDAARSRSSEVAILTAALLSAYTVGEFDSAPDSQAEHEQGTSNAVFTLPKPAASISSSVPTVSQTANPFPQTHSTANNEPSRTTTSAKTSKTYHDKREATYIGDYAIDTSASITTASATVAGPSGISGAKNQKADSIAGRNNDESSGSQKASSGSNDAERTDKKDKKARGDQGGSASTLGGDASKAGPHGSNPSEGSGKSSASSDSGSGQGNSPKGHRDKDKKGGKGNGGKGNNGKGNGKGAD